MNHNYLDMAFSEIGPQLKAAESKAELVKLLKAYLKSCINDFKDELDVQEILHDIQNYADHKTRVISDDKDYAESLSQFYILFDSKKQ